MTNAPSPEHRARVRQTQLDPEQLRAMGEVAVWSARVEHALSLVVMALISDDDVETNEIGIVMTRGVPFSRLLEMGAQLVKLRRYEGEVRDRFAELSTASRLAMETRNLLLHGHWTRPLEGPALTRLLRKTGSPTRAFTVTQIEDASYDLAAAAEELLVLFLTIEGRIEH